MSSRRLHHKEYRNMTWLRDHLLLLAVAKDRPHASLVMEREH